ncbi:MAG TPA: hypothetical protein VGH33_20445 [Isosphaeraceae bacterium]
MLSSVSEQVVMASATTLDSKGVTVTYQVEGSAPAGPIALAVDRSATPSAGPGDMPVGTATIFPSQLDWAGRPATAPGEHTVTVPLAGGLPDNPEHPYVVVVADPGGPGASEASFRVFTIGVIVHGGAEASSANTYGPAWEPKLAGKLRAEGYDFVIPFVWASKSWTPGAAAKQAHRLARVIANATAMAPAGDVVDLHAIAHSEGAVIASRALQSLQSPPALAQGWVELTLLDPHPANNDPGGPQWSADSGLVNNLVHAIMDTYQGWAHDPVPYIPAIVDDAQVFYQKTPVGLAKTGLVNFWGRVPVAAAPGVPVHYASLTGPGVSHSGDFDVRDWYWFNIVPLLGDGPAFFNPALLTAARAEPGPGGQHFFGTASPGASVEVFALPPGSHTPIGIGRTKANAQGDWSLSSSADTPTSGRFFARSALAAFPGARRTFVMHTVRVFEAGT